MVSSGKIIEVGRAAEERGKEFGDVLSSGRYIEVGRGAGERDKEVGAILSSGRTADVGREAGERDKGDDGVLSSEIESRPISSLPISMLFPRSWGDGRCGGGRMSMLFPRSWEPWRDGVGVPLGEVRSVEGEGAEGCWRGRNDCLAKL